MLIAAVRPCRGCSVYSPFFHAGSFLMLSMIILRITRLRPAIWVGALASGTMASTKSGYISPQTQQCIAPMDVPRTTRRWFTSSPSVRSA